MRKEIPWLLLSVLVIVAYFLVLRSSTANTGEIVDRGYPVAGTPQ